MRRRAPNAFPLLFSLFRSGRHRRYLLRPERFARSATRRRQHRQKKKKKKTRLAREKPAVSDAIAKSGRHTARQRRTSILAASSVGTNAPARTSKQGVGETLRALAYLRESSKHAKGCGSAVPQRNGERKEKNPLTATG